MKKMKMRIGKRKFVVLLVMALLALAIIGLFSIRTYAEEQEVYVVATDAYGKSNYILSYGDGTFSSQQYMGEIPQPYYSYGNGIGDFDNDGDFDYVIGTGSKIPYYTYHIYLYEKLGPGNDFASPVSVDTWTEGWYANDFAVADYNNDGNMDFVLTHHHSSNSELYLGNGDLTFTRSVLAGTLPYDSVGADSEDFNNDGNADFVAAEYGSPPIEEIEEEPILPSNETNPYYIYVNLGNGDGTFTTTSFVASASAWGVTAGDFDNDGNADIISGGLYGWHFYKGNGDGTFQTGVAVSGVVYFYSPIDNYDFDNDGNQDIVIGYSTCARYYSGNGDGTFTYVTEITGGSGFWRMAISAPPPTPAITATIDIDPDTLNLKSNGQWITAYIELPDGYDVANINLTTVLLAHNEFHLPAVTDPQYGFVTDPHSYLMDHDEDGIMERMVKFDRAVLRDYLGEADLSDGDKFFDITLTVAGQLADGTSFEGTDTVVVIKK